MVRLYTWRLDVRSYEGDAWGMVPASGILRYLEQTAVAAAADGGYGAEFHRERGSAWVVRRLTLLMHAPARQGDELEITTWASHFTKVRGVREYKISHAGGSWGSSLREAPASLMPNSGRLLYTGIAEWVYLDRRTLTPLPIPPGVAEDFDVPGAPLQEYDPPHIEQDSSAATQANAEFTVERTAEWHEADSMGHVNNANYADWLDDAVRAAVAEMGWSVEAMRGMGLHLRGEYYNLNYRRAALPGDRLRITTRIEGTSKRLYAVRQEIRDGEGASVLEASGVYGWRDGAGEPAVKRET